MGLAGLKRWVGWFGEQDSLLSGVLFGRDGWGGQDDFYFIYSEFSLVKNVLKLKPAKRIRWRGTRTFERDRL